MSKSLILWFSSSGKKNPPSKISDSLHPIGRIYLPHSLPLSGKPCINGTNFLPTLESCTFKDISGFFRKSKNFSRLYHFFILKKPKICMKFHKNFISCFLEKLVLINWMTDWQWCFHKTPFCLKTRVQQYL